jgi:CheY-like chemotaxis protein
MVKETAKVNIIVVEDELLVAQNISSRLTENNYNVLGIADSVKDALMLLSEHRDVDILLLDIILKGEQDGIDLASIINETYSIPFIFLTSHVDSVTVQRAKEVKPSAYILKPFNDRQVCIAIELALKFQK